MAWCSQGLVPGREFLQIHVPEAEVICAVATQGTGFGSGNEHVKEYYLGYSRDGINWKMVEERGNLKVLFEFKILFIFLCNKLTSVFYASVLLLMINCVITLSKCFAVIFAQVFKQSNNLIIFVDHCLFCIRSNCIGFLVFCDYIC